MLDDLMGQSGAMQEKMNAQLAEIKIEHETQGIKLVGNATGKILDVDIDAALLSIDNKEMIEDLLLTCVQEFGDKVNIESQAVSQNMLKDMFSGGGLGNLFG